MSEKKIILACLNGGLSTGVAFWRTYLSDVMHTAVKETRRDRQHDVGLQSWAKGFPLPVDDSKRYPRRVRKVMNKARENWSQNNALVLLGKSCGADNWITHLDQFPGVFNGYKWAGAMFVDTNVGPRVGNRNAELKQVNTTGLDHLVGLYTTDKKWGGYLLDGDGSPDTNKRIDGYSHHNCCKSDLVLDEVIRAIMAADKALSS